MNDSSGEESPIPRSSGVTLNVFATQYDIVREVGKEVFHWRISRRDSDKWDVCWIDTGMTAERLIRMKPYQKINHFPGMHALARKNCLAVNLMEMQAALPGEFDFFPQTWLLPKDYADLKKLFSAKKSRTFIVKPEAECQGRGIFLTRDISAIPLGSRYVVQRYISKPYLIDQLKFDLRIYVLVTSCDPLRVYVHEEGLARFATEPYSSPLTANIAETCMHLTNYAINKDNAKFVFNTDAGRDDVGHKRSLTAVFKFLRSQGHDTASLWASITSIIVKTLLTAQPTLAHIYRSCQPLDPADSLCFEILGIDILLDHALKPWLLEVNHSPSFTTDTPLDHDIKRKVIGDALALLDVSREHREEYFRLMQDGFYQRIIRSKVSTEAKQQLLRKQQHSFSTRQRLDESHCGGFQRLFPTSSPSPFDQVLTTAQKLWLSRARNRVQKTEEEKTPIKAKSVIKKPASRQEPAQEEPRRQRTSKFLGPRVSSVHLESASASLDHSLQRSFLLRRVPDGSFIKPRVLEFGFDHRTEKKQKAPLSVGWRIREMLKM